MPLENPTYPYSKTSIESYLENHSSIVADESFIDNVRKGNSYLPGQIVEISLTGNGRVPVIVTKVHPIDENFNLSYDILMLIGDRIKSFIVSGGRYLWRFTETPNDETIANIEYLVGILFDPNIQYGNLLSLNEDFKLTSLCYLKGEDVIQIDIKDLPRDKGIILK